MEKIQLVNWGEEKNKKGRKRKLNKPPAKPYSKVVFTRRTWNLIYLKLEL